MNYTSPRETRRTMEGEEEEDGFTYQREISCRSLFYEDPSLAGGNRLQIHHRSLIRARSVANQSSSSPEAETPHGATGRSFRPAELWICPPVETAGFGASNPRLMGFQTHDYPTRGKLAPWVFHPGNIPGSRRGLRFPNEP